MIHPSKTVTLGVVYIIACLCSQIRYVFFAFTDWSVDWAARVVTMTRKFDHISPVLYKLHWLPVKFRIQFKLILLVFKALNGLAPSYLSDKLVLKSNKKLRSGNQKLLEIPLSRTKSYGDRSFSIAGPRLWNNLPKNLRLCSSIDVFKKNLKTHLFKNTFPKSLVDSFELLSD